MGFLESVGMLAILFALLIFYLKYLSSKEHPTVKLRNIEDEESKEYFKTDNPLQDTRVKEINTIKDRITSDFGHLPEEVEFSLLIPFSNKCHKIIHKHDIRSFESNTQISSRQRDKELKNTLKDPLEFWRAMEGYYKNQKYKEIQAIEEVKRKEYYVKYGELVFEVFDIYTYRVKSEIIENIKSKLDSNYTKANELFDIMQKYWLIEELIDNNGEPLEDLFEINAILSHGNYESKIKITRVEWLKRNNKVLIDNIYDYVGG